MAGDKPGRGGHGRDERTIEDGDDVETLMAVVPPLRAPRPRFDNSDVATVEDSLDSVLGAMEAAVPSDDALVGTVVHGYELTEFLGAGTWARVYRARHEVLDRACAVKVVALDLEEAAARLLREAELLGRLRHENIVRVLDCGLLDDGRPWLSMELLDGLALEAAIGGKPMAPARVAALTWQIARGLKEAHRHGLVHRDLKPENIMLVREGGEERAKILDFGLARDSGGADKTRLTQFNQLVGSPAYMAPEQVGGAGVGPAADLYALGAIMHTMLSGKPPFEAATLPELLNKHIFDPPPPLLEAGGLELISEALMHKTIAGRLGPAEAVMKRVEALPIFDSKGARRAPAPEPPRVMNHLVVAVLVVAIAMLCGAIFVVATSDRAEPVLAEVQEERPAPAAGAPSVGVLKARVSAALVRAGLSSEDLSGDLEVAARLEAARRSESGAAWSSLLESITDLPSLRRLGVEKLNRISASAPDAELTDRASASRASLSAATSIEDVERVMRGIDALRREAERPIP